MTELELILVIVSGALAALIVLGLISWIVMYAIIARIVFIKVLKRESKDKWGRQVSSGEDDYLEMYAQGAKWQEKHKDKKRDVHIVNDGLNLYGEYYDLGFKQCVIVLSGRMEALTYGYFFAVPYAERGFNALVIDPRGHGLSDGEFNTGGFEESKDALAWARFIHDEFGIERIIFHGICIGSAGAMYAVTSENCPDYVGGMVAEGMFATFNESMKNHLRERKKPVFLLNDMINFWFKRYLGHSMKEGPIDYIGKLNKPILMLHSKEDTYSTPEFAQQLYDKCGSDKKMIVWFEHGRHSMLRITDTDRYDKAIEKFLEENFADKKAA